VRMSAIPHLSLTSQAHSIPCQSFIDGEIHDAWYDLMEGGNQKSGEVRLSNQPSAALMLLSLSLMCTIDPSALTAPRTIGPK
jgi:hypothetical protein